MLHPSHSSKLSHTTHENLTFSSFAACPFNGREMDDFHSDQKQVSVSVNIDISVLYRYQSTGSIYSRFRWTIKQCVESGFIGSGSRSSVFGWIPIRIQGFYDQELKQMYSWKQVRKYRYVREVLRIRNPVPFWPDLDTGWVKNQDPDPEWTSHIIFLRA